MAEPYIVCENLVKIYKIAELEVVALQGLDLTVQRGEMLGIVGASGSGKSSLLNILGGLDRPSAGRIYVDRIDLLKMDDRAIDAYRRSKVGFVWQQGSRNLIPYLSALENVYIPMLLAGVNERKARQRAESLLEAVGLADRQHHHLVQLSGGEQQRVAIAVALVNEPSLLLADEPTGEVDTATSLTIYEAFKRLSRELGLTTVIVSHDPGIARHVDRVVAVRDGKLASETLRHNDHAGDHYQELVVLDSAGRLQVPKEYLVQYGIQRRVQLEMSEQGILIRPVSQAGSEANVGNDDEPPGEDEPALRSGGGLQNAFERIRKAVRGRRPA